MNLPGMLGTGTRTGGDLDLSTDGFNGGHVLLGSADALMSRYQEVLEADSIVSEWLSRDLLHRIEITPFRPFWDFGDFPMIAIYPASESNQQPVPSQVLDTQVSIFFGFRWELSDVAPQDPWQPGVSSIVAQLRRALNQQVTLPDTVEGEEVCWARDGRNSGMAFFVDVDPEIQTRHIATLEFERTVHVHLNKTTGIHDALTGPLGL